MAVYFKNGKPEETTTPELAVKLTQREVVLQRMLKEEGYSSLDEVVKEDFNKYLVFRKKLFEEYKKKGL